MMASRMSNNEVEIFLAELVSRGHVRARVSGPRIFQLPSQIWVWKSI